MVSMQHFAEGWVACDPLLQQLFETPRQCHLLPPFIVIAPMIYPRRASHG